MTESHSEIPTYTQHPSLGSIFLLGVSAIGLLITLGVLSIGIDAHGVQPHAQEAPQHTLFSVVKVEGRFAIVAQNSLTDSENWYRQAESALPGAWQKSPNKVYMTKVNRPQWIENIPALFPTFAHIKDLRFVVSEKNVQVSGEVLTPRQLYGIQSKMLDIIGSQEHLDLNLRLSAKNPLLPMYHYQRHPVEKIDLSAVRFMNDDVVLSQRAKEALDAAAQTLQQYPMSHFEVAVHTDNTLSDEVNIPVSQLRADAVMRYLLEKRISEARMQSRGYGAIRPIADNTDEQGRLRNQRVEFIVLRNKHSS